MKKRKHIRLLSTVILLCAAFSCIKEEHSDCPPEAAIYLQFKCINPTYLFEQIVEEVNILFYHPDGTLAQNNTYTRRQLQASGWLIPLTGEETAPYTLVAHTNYHHDHITVNNIQNKQNLLTTIACDSEREINYPLHDTWHGTHQLHTETTADQQIHTILLSKNTNTITLEIQFETPALYQKVTNITSHIQAANILYRWDNTIPPHDPVRYIPYSTTHEETNQTYTQHNKTMRIWTTADMKLHLTIQADATLQRTIDIPATLALVQDSNGEYLYNTDQKLEQHDHFHFLITIGEGYIISEVQINGWYIIDHRFEI